MLVRTIAFVLLLCQSCNVVVAENRTRVAIDLQVEAGAVSDRMDAVIHGDGFLDLSQLTFESMAGTAKQNEAAGAAAEASTNGTEVPSSKTHVHIIDIAVFGYDPQSDPDSDNQNRNHHVQSKRLGELGVGAFGNDTEYYICCSKSAVEARACSMKNYGRLITQPMLFAGGVLPLSFVDEHGEKTDTASFPPGYSGTIYMEGTGHVSVMIGNCNPLSPILHVSGEMVEMSYAAANDLPFYIVLTTLHLALLFWFRYLMQANASERIRIEEWIFGTICLAAVDIVLHMTYEMAIANVDHDIRWLDTLGVVAHAAKHGLSRCLYLMVSLGWGVVRETLAKQTMYFLYFLGAAYAVSVSFYDIFVIFGWYEESEGDAEFMVNCFLASFVIDVIFIVWIPFGLNRTMAVLRLYRQERKLERYVWLWRIFVVAVAISIGMSILFVIDSVNNGSEYIDGETLERSNEIIYLFILSCIAYLWRPNPQAKLYSNYQVMESNYDDDDDYDDDNIVRQNGLAVIRESDDNIILNDDDGEIEFDLEHPEDEGLEMTSTNATFSDEPPDSRFQIE